MLVKEAVGHSVFNNFNSICIGHRRILCYVQNSLLPELAATMSQHHCLSQFPANQDFTEAIDQWKSLVWLILLVWKVRITEMFVGRDMEPADFILFGFIMNATTFKHCQ